MEKTSRREQKRLEKELRPLKPWQDHILDVVEADAIRMPGSAVAQSHNLWRKPSEESFRFALEAAGVDLEAPSLGAALHGVGFKPLSPEAVELLPPNVRAQYDWEREVLDTPGGGYAPMPPTEKRLAEIAIEQSQTE